MNPMGTSSMLKPLGYQEMCFAIPSFGYWFVHGILQMMAVNLQIIRQSHEAWQVMKGEKST